MATGASRVPATARSSSKGPSAFAGAVGLARLLPGDRPHAARRPPRDRAARRARARRASIATGRSNPISTRPVTEYPPFDPPPVILAPRERRSMRTPNEVRGVRPQAEGFSPKPVTRERKKMSGRPVHLLTAAAIAAAASLLSISTASAGCYSGCGYSYAAPVALLGAGRLQLFVCGAVTRRRASVRRSCGSCGSVATATRRADVCRQPGPDLHAAGDRRGRRRSIERRLRRLSVRTARLWHALATAASAIAATAIAASRRWLRLSAARLSLRLRGYRGGASAIAAARLSRRPPRRHRGGMAIAVACGYRGGIAWVACRRAHAAVAAA